MFFKYLPGSSAGDECDGVLTALRPLTRLAPSSIERRTPQTHPADEDMLTPGEGRSPREVHHEGLPATPRPCGGMGEGFGCVAG